MQPGKQAQGGVKRPRPGVAAPPAGHLKRQRLQQGGIGAPPHHTPPRPGPAGFQAHYGVVNGASPQGARAAQPQAVVYHQNPTGYGYASGQGPRRLLVQNAVGIQHSPAAPPGVAAPALVPIHGAVGQPQVAMAVPAQPGHVVAGSPGQQPVMAVHGQPPAMAVAGQPAAVAVAGQPGAAQMAYMPVQQQIPAGYAQAQQIPAGYAQVPAAYAGMYGQQVPYGYAMAPADGAYELDYSAVQAQARDPVAEANAFGKARCSIHGKMRTIQNLVCESGGVFVCVPGSYCKTQGPGAGGNTRPGEHPVFVCSIHGKRRGGMYLEHANGKWKCKAGFECL